MPEIFASQALRHIDGRNLGIQSMFPGQSGAATANGPKYDFLTGPDDMRRELTTANSTAVNIKATGIAALNGTSAASSSVYTLDPPIPGIRKIISLASTANGPVYIKTQNGEFFNTTAGTTNPVVKITAGVLDLVGLSTAVWGVLSGSVGYTFSATT